jgi:hypothetical protein
MARLGGDPAGLLVICGPCLWYYVVLTVLLNVPLIGFSGFVGSGSSNEFMGQLCLVGSIDNLVVGLSLIRVV